MSESNNHPMSAEGRLRTTVSSSVEEPVIPQWHNVPMSLQEQQDARFQFEEDHRAERDNLASKIANALDAMTRDESPMIGAIADWDKETWLFGLRDDSTSDEYYAEANRILCVATLDAYAIWAAHRIAIETRPADGDDTLDLIHARYEGLLTRFQEAVLDWRREFNLVSGCSPLSREILKEAAAPDVSSGSSDDAQRA